jgi:diacylglycerol kinase family enzyme
MCSMAPAAAITFILNHGAGTGRAGELQATIERFAQEAGIAVRILVAQEGADLPEMARGAIKDGARAVIAGGGDGTVSAVAGALVDSEVSLGVLALGTLNHFAKDMGLPLGEEDAVRAALSGQVVSVDVGEVNGRIFLNNSSIGLYPRIVRFRDAERRKGRSKWLAFLHAIFAILRRHGLFHAELQIDETKSLSRRTAFVFMGNNEYEKTGLKIGARLRLDGGSLWLCLPRRGGRIDLLRLAVLALLGRLQDGDLECLTAAAVTIKTRKKQLHVALDGEVFSMTVPLAYRIRRRALKVIAPAAGIAQEKAGAGLSEEFA